MNLEQMKYQGFSRNGLFSLDMQQSALTIMLTEKRNLFSLGFCISASILPRFPLFSWQNRFSARFISCHHSRSFIALSSLFGLRFSFSVRSRLGPQGLLVIASSKLRYVWILAHMKERRRKGCKSTRERVRASHAKES